MGNTVATMDEYVANPGLFKRSVEEASAKLAKELTKLD